MNSHKLREKKSDISNEVIKALSDVKRMHAHRADGTTAEEVAAALQEVSGIIKKMSLNEKEVVSELTKLDIEELKKKREFLINQTRNLLKDLYTISAQISRNIKILRLLNRILEKKILEKRSSEL